MIGWHPGPVIKLDNIGVRFGSKDALRGVSVQIEAGTSLALVGSNGSGKTTLLNSIAGIVPLSTGSRSPTPFPDVAYVLQTTGRSNWLPLTVCEVIAMGRYPHLGLFQRLRDSDRDIMTKSAERMDVCDLMDTQFGELSGGQRQRVLIAQAITRQAPVLLLDEPITGLDIPSQNLIFDLIESEVEAGVTVVLTTHHLDEARHCDRVALMNGNIVAIGTPPEVLTPDLLRLAFGAKVLGQHDDHDHADSLLVIDDHGHHHDPH